MFEKCPIIDIVDCEPPGATMAATCGYRDIDATNCPLRVKLACLRFSLRRI